MGAYNRDPFLAFRNIILPNQPNLSINPVSSHRRQRPPTMVADAVIYHPSVAHYLKYMSTTLGRDKLLRVVQYFSRFYAWYLLRTNAVPSAIAPWTALKKQFGLIRKSMRPILKYMTVGRQLGYAGYLSFDAATVLDAAGVRKWEGAERAQKEAYRFWTMGLACSVIMQTYTLWKLKEREARVDKKDGEGVVESKRITMERAASKTQLISDLCDLTVPLSALAWVNFDDGVVGIAGTFSSLIGVYSQWKKTA